MVKEVIKKVFEKQTILQIPQSILLLLSYYLMFNSLYNLLESKIVVPEKIIDFNSKVLATIDEWNYMILLLGVALIITGFINSALTIFPILENFKVFGFSGIGMFVGIWVVANSLLYYLYSWFPSVFIFIYSISIIIIVALYKTVFSKTTTESTPSSNM